MWFDLFARGTCCFVGGALQVLAFKAHNTFRGCTGGGVVVNCATIVGTSAPPPPPQRAFKHQFHFTHTRAHAHTAMRRHAHTLHVPNASLRQMCSP